MNTYEKKYTVWVGGVEVTDYYIDRDTADELLMEYIDKGYDIDDVYIDEMETIKGKRKC